MHAEGSDDRKEACIDLCSLPKDASIRGWTNWRELILPYLDKLENLGHEVQVCFSSRPQKTMARTIGPSSFQKPVQGGQKNAQKMRNVPASHPSNSGITFLAEINHVTKKKKKQFP